MKTKEQQAEEYAKQQKNIRLFGQRVCRNISIEERQEDAFIAGYEAAQKWISISEEPIPLNIECNCIDSKGRIFYCNHSNESDRDSICIYYNITHWLPIPKLPTE